ncbi:MAG: alpha-glucosidase, partial [Anaerolineae bacterium]|nr:alpha-glucosidase [Anaerolineae bacterium]
MSTLNLSLFERIRFGGDPVANPKNVVALDRARFTLLTPRLVRMEWSETGQFEDHGTYAFPTRRAEAIPFVARKDGTDTLIDTGALRLRYRQTDGPFSAENLSAAFDLDGQTVIWTPGAANPYNLRGTRRTLDGCTGDAALDEGLLSRAGWTLFDDSANVVFDTVDGWVTPRPAHALQDWYLFAYGHDYKGALAEYTRFGGAVPLIPRFVLGGWWSRYWAYSAQDLQDLVGEFEAHDVPLDVLVIDMDWHTPHAWTGYTWNRKLFPDPPGFLRWVHDKGLRATLNLHPAQGIQHFEEVYPQFAEAMGIDPQGSEAIPFRIATKGFVQSYFELIHHAMEDQGVDFWWMDWQQGESSEVKGLDPLTWLNHIHFNDSRRRGRRPMLYSRWGGLGNHRYYIGFSGDTIVGWPALQFQPYMTAAASNVAYGWWSHDIGGHMGGATEPELYARWVQFGALSPCLRLHSTKDPRFERRPWAYPDDVYRAARAAFHLRYQLVPYLYTMARVASETGVSLCRPMYYEHPEVEDAYTARYQYYLGDQAIAAPVIFPADPATGLAASDVWVPAGTWIDYQTKETFSGPRWVRLLGGIDRMPLLVKAGGILPLAMEFA